MNYVGIYWYDDKLEVATVSEQYKQVVLWKPGQNSVDKVFFIVLNAITSI